MECGLAWMIEWLIRWLQSCWIYRSDNEGTFRKGSEEKGRGGEWLGDSSRVAWKRKEAFFMEMYDLGVGNSDTFSLHPSATGLVMLVIILSRQAFVDWMECRIGRCLLYDILKKR